jgi:hypothetical protein
MNQPHSTSHQLYELEDLLGEILTPVKPRPQFVADLKRQLVEVNLHTSITASEMLNSHRLILVVASVASGAFLLLTGTRLVMTLVGAISALHMLKREGAKKQLPTAPSTA